MQSPQYVLITINLLAGFGCAVPIARLLRAVNGKKVRSLRYFVILIGIYFVESIAIAMGMGIPVFSVALAFLWGILFGLWLRTCAPARDVLKATVFLALYSSLPAASFLAVPAMVWIGGGHVLSAEEGARFGIPEFLHLPWPLNTILGFYAALVIGAVLSKTVITVGEVSVLVHLAERPRAWQSQENPAN
jgi:hypothetical protein